LADRLWKNFATTQSKGYLRKALWQLQTTLDMQADGLSDDVLLVGSGWVQINPQAELYSDVAAFERAFLRARGTRGKDLDMRCASVLQAAIDLYRGDLLEGWYQDWCLFERERLRHMYFAMLDKLMEYCEVYHDFESGLLYGSRVLHYDRARERTHRRLMRLCCLAGDRTEALRQYQRCVTALDEELGVEPSRRTVKLYQQIRADQLGCATPRPADSKGTSEMSPSISEVLYELQQLQKVLARVQYQVQRNTHTLKRAHVGR
jgi:DNA-binding SARP family transcriptional activator